eukprot:3804055-Amphidinium_carterae.1
MLQFTFSACRMISARIASFWNVFNGLTHFKGVCDSSWKVYYPGLAIVVVLLSLFKAISCMTLLAQGPSQGLAIRDW